MNDQLTDLLYAVQCLILLLCTGIFYRVYCLHSKWTRTCSRRSHLEHL